MKTKPNESSASGNSKLPTPFPPTESLGRGLLEEPAGPFTSSRHLGGIMEHTYEVLGLKTEKEDTLWRGKVLWESR